MVKSENPNLRVFSVNPVYPFLILYLFLFTGAFVMMWSSGILPYGRILNSLFFIFLFGWFYIVATLFYYFREKINLHYFRNTKYVTILSVIIILTFLIKDNNIKTAYTEIFDGSAMNFKTEINERYRDLLQDNCDSCEIKHSVTAPESFFFMDIVENPDAVYNIGYAKYFNKSSIVLKEVR